MGDKRSRIIKALKDAQTSPVSGEELGLRLGISRTMVWKYIKSLQADGYEIDHLRKADHVEYLKADEMGRLVIPPDVSSKYGINPGSQIRVDVDADGLYIRRSPHRLAKLYIEPTNQCNLKCRTCIRNFWNEPMGKMSKSVFKRIIEGIKAFSSLPEVVFFGGFGEPLFHPDIVDMITQVKKLGISVELITNGMLLTKDMSRALINAGLDRLWVSLDGATPESYADIRLGAALPLVLENLAYFYENNYEEWDTQECHHPIRNPRTKIGIEFVAMKRNIADLPAVVNIGKRFDVDRFLVTNVLPYSKNMIDETLYYLTIPYKGNNHLRLPLMDMNETTRVPLYQSTLENIGTWPGINHAEARNRCPFIESGAGAISWDGNLSPRLPLLHSHTSYLGFLRVEERYSRRWAIGNIVEKNLLDLWNTPEHLAFRERVQAFSFAPCITCSGCDLSESNEEDCLNNCFPTCGGCLWAQGVIRCP